MEGFKSISKGLTILQTMSLIAVVGGLISLSLSVYQAKRLQSQWLAAIAPVQKTLSAAIEACVRRHQGQLASCATPSQLGRLRFPTHPHVRLIFPDIATSSQAPAISFSLVGTGKFENSVARYVAEPRLGPHWLQWRESSAEEARTRLSTS